MKKKIIFASDYRGVDFKKQLFEYAKTLNREIADIGIDHGSTVDYIDITKELVTQIFNNDAYGVIVCGSGQGVAMVANRYVNIRAAVCRNKQDAEDVRSKLDANVLCLGSKQTPLTEAIECLNVFLNTKFKAEKHEKCVSKLSIKPIDHTYNGINMIVRDIIIHEKHVLLSTVTGSNSHFAQNLFFLPGGHVDYNESAIVALRRELKEEMNIDVLNEIDFVSALECTWNRKGNIYHELNLIYRINIANLDLSNPPISTESSLKFLWVPLDKLKDYKILPEKLVSVILAEADPKQKKELFLSQML